MISVYLLLAPPIIRTHLCTCTMCIPVKKLNSLIYSIIIIKSFLIFVLLKLIYLT